MRAPRIIVVGKLDPLEKHDVARIMLDSRKGILSGYHLAVQSSRLLVVWLLGLGSPEACRVKAQVERLPEAQKYVT